MFFVHEQELKDNLYVDDNEDICVYEITIKNDDFEVTMSYDEFMLLHTGIEQARRKDEFYFKFNYLRLI